MSEELKPCPFCGGTDLEKIMCCDLVGWLYRIKCKKCEDVMITSLADMDDAIKKWNTRPAEVAKDKEIERLKAEQGNTLMILRQLDWLYSKENEKARMWELKIGGLSPSEWMCDIVQKARQIITTKGGEDD